MTTTIAAMAIINLHEKKNYGEILTVSTRVVSYEITNEQVRARTGQHSIENIISERRLRWLGHLIRMDHPRLPQQALYWEVPGSKRGADRPRTGVIKHYTGESSRIQGGTRPAKDRLERRHQERSSKNGTHLVRGGGSRPQQTRVASECGPVRSLGRGLNQVSYSYYFATARTVRNALSSVNLTTPKRWSLLDASGRTVWRRPPTRQWRILGSSSRFWRSSRRWWRWSCRRRRLRQSQ